MSEYETLKAEYEDLKLPLLKLEMLQEQARRAWCVAGYDDKKTYKELSDADKNLRDMQKSVKAIALKLVVIEHKELGTSLNKLSRKYDITTVTIKKLLEANGVAYLRPTLVQWLPIGTAPKDGTKFLASMAGGDMAEVELVSYNEDSSEWRNYAYDPPNIEEDWMTHWMPLPEPPALEEKKDD
jgi:hypothetical protein